MKVSIIIPYYNGPEDYIRKALDSALKQVFDSFEILVVDDGSSPENHARLEAMCEGEEIIRLLTITHAGVSAARNAGILHAKGEYLAFLDADDFLAEDFLERAWTVVQESSADMVIGGTFFSGEIDAYRFPERKDTIGYHLYHEKEIRQLLPCFVGQSEQIRFPEGYINKGPVARLIRTGLAKETPFDENLKIGEDILWVLQLLEHCTRLCIVPEVWYAYRINRDSATHRYRPGYVNECEAHIRCLPSVLDLRDEREYRAYTERIYEMLQLSWSNALRTERRTDRQEYRNATGKIYTEWPWREIGSARFFRTAKGKKKIGALLFRTHAFFGAKALKEKLLRRED